MLLAVPSPGKLRHSGRPSVLLCTTWLLGREKPHEDDEIRVNKTGVAIVKSSESWNSLLSQHPAKEPCVQQRVPPENRPDLCFC